MVFWSTCAISL